MIYVFSSSPETIERSFKAKGIAYQLVNKEQYGIFLQEYIPQKGDWGVVYDFGKIIPESLLQNLLLLNIHFSLLPKYRGAIPVEAAIREGEKKTGITVQKMAKGMDAGAILLQREVEIDEDWTAGELQTYMDSLLPEIFDKILLQQPEDWVFVPQEGEPSYCYIRELTREHAKLEPRNCPANQFIRNVRAYNPEPLAWMTIIRNGSETTMNVLRAMPYSESGELAPGTFAFVKKLGLIVGTKKGTVLVTELIVAGSKKLAGENILALKGSLEKIL